MPKSDIIDAMNAVFRYLREGPRCPKCRRPHTLIQNVHNRSLVVCTSCGGPYLLARLNEQQVKAWTRRVGLTLQIRPRRSRKRLALHHRRGPTLAVLTKTEHAETHRPRRNMLGGR